jgi:hypothetical protein
MGASESAGGSMTRLPTRHERDAIGARAIALGIDDFEPGPCEDPDAEPEPERWTCRDCGEVSDFEDARPHYDLDEPVCAYCWGHYDHDGTDSDDRRHDDWRDRRLFGD